MLLACFATFLFTSSKAEILGWVGTGGGLLVMEGSGSSEDRVPMLDKAAVMVATGKIQKQNKKTDRSNEKERQLFFIGSFKLSQVCWLFVWPTYTFYLM